MRCCDFCIRGNNKHKQQKRMNVLRSVRDRGLVETVKRFVKYDTLKAGRLVGTDKYGNNYYENKELMYGQHRWVEYADDDYDASHGTRAFLVFDSTNIFSIQCLRNGFFFLFLFSLNFVFSEGTPGCITPWKMILSSNLYVVFCELKISLTHCTWQPPHVVYQREHVPNKTGTREAYHPQNIKEMELK